MHVFILRVNKDTKEPDVYVDEILIQSIPDSLNKITALLHQKDLSMFVADTVVDMRDVMEFSPGSKYDMLECLEETLTEEELLFLEEETKLAKMELQNLRVEKGTGKFNPLFPHPEEEFLEEEELHKIDRYTADILSLTKQKEDLSNEE
eukprot:sb/3473653/